MAIDNFSCKLTKDTLLNTKYYDNTIIFESHFHVPNDYSHYNWYEWLKMLESPDDVVINSFVDYSYPYPLSNPKCYYLLSFKNEHDLVLFKIRFSVEYSITLCKYRLNNNFKVIHSVPLDVSLFNDNQLAESKHFVDTLDDAILVMKTIPQFSLTIFEIIHSHTSGRVVDMMTYRYGSKVKGIHFYSMEDVKRVSDELKNKSIGFSLNLLTR